MFHPLKNNNFPNKLSQDVDGYWHIHFKFPSNHRGFTRLLTTTQTLIANRHEVKAKVKNIINRYELYRVTDRRSHVLAAPICAPLTGNTLFKPLPAGKNFIGIYSNSTTTPRLSRRTYGRYTPKRCGFFSWKFGEKKRFRDPQRHTLWWYMTVEYGWWSNAHSKWSNAWMVPFLTQI